MGSKVMNDVLMKKLGSTRSKNDDVRVEAPRVGFKENFCQPPHTAAMSAEISTGQVASTVPCLGAEHATKNSHFYISPPG